MLHATIAPFGHGSLGMRGRLAIAVGVGVGVGVVVAAAVLA
jgi:hypothetical protein